MSKFASKAKSVKAIPIKQSAPGSKKLKKNKNVQVKKTYQNLNISKIACKAKRL